MASDLREQLRSLPPGVVAVPTMEWMWTSSVVALFNLGGHGLPAGSSMQFGRCSSNAAANRNELTERFLKDPANEWILYVDSDMTPEPHVVARLLSHGVDVAGALCFIRKPPFGAAVGLLPGEGVHLDVDDDRLIEVGWLGMGCVMVRRRVIEAMPYPWFEHPNVGNREDVLFSEKARALGFPVHLDAGLVVGHMLTRAIGKEEAAWFQQQPLGQQMIASPLRSERADRLGEKGRREALERLATAPSSQLPDPAAKR